MGICITSNTTNNKLLEIESSIFEDINQDLKSCPDKSDNCIVIKRLLTTLSYYSHLDINSNTNDRLIFNNFIETVYKYKIYDDFYLFVYIVIDITESINLMMLMMIQ